MWIIILSLLLRLNFFAPLAPAQEFSSPGASLSRDYFKNGEQTLLAFESISRATRDSVVKIDLNGNTVTLAAVIDAGGLAVTKASEIKEGELTAWLANGKEVDVHLIARDEENDLALVQVNAKNLKPIQWATGEAFVGQWVVTPGIAETPQAVGIVSVPPRNIPPPRAFIGVVLDFQSSDAKIAQVMEGLGAEAAGLKPGDRILTVNDSPVKEGPELIKKLRKFREGQSVKVRVQRGEEEFDATIQMLATKPERGGRGFDRADRMNQMGSVTSQRAEDFELVIQHDTVLQNWQCGGPLMNLEGKAVGLNIARAGRVASYALPATVVKQAIARLKAQPEATERKTGQLESRVTSRPPLLSQVQTAHHNTGITMKNLNRPAALLLSFLATTVAFRGSAQDWPQWRGANRDARATQFAAPKTWPKELKQKWKVTVGDGVATPSLVGDKLYVFSRQEGNEITRCLDAATGKEVWQEKYESLGATGPASGFSGPRSSPTVAAGKVVTLGVRGMLSCLDAATGKKVWRKNDYPDAYPRFHPASSPLVVDGWCIAQLGGPSEGVVAAYDLASGDEKWKWSGDSPAYASPALMSVSGTKLIVAETERRIVAVNAADGKLVWETPFAVRGMGGYNAATPIVDGQTIIYTGSGRGAKAVKIEKGGDGLIAKELWSNEEKSVQFNTPVLKEGLLYGLTAGNEFFCINTKDGQTAWSAPANPAGADSPGGAGGPPRGPGGPGGRGRGGRGGGGRGGYGSIVDAGSVLIALTPSSELIVFQPGDKAYTELARIKVADTETHAYPVVSGNRVFIKDKDSVTLWTID